MGNLLCCFGGGKTAAEDLGERPSLPKGILLGVGNPLLDIVVTVDTHFIQDHGLELHGVTRISDDKLDFYQLLIQDLLASYDKGIKYIAGGSVQNVVRVAQWILGSWNATVFMGSIGDDDFGKILFRKLLDDGVIGEYQIVEAIPTGTCLAMITGTKRTLVACLGAADCFRTDFLQNPKHFTWVEKAEYYFLSGFFLAVNAESSLIIAKYCTEHDRTLAFHLSAPYVCASNPDEVKSILPHTSLLFGNAAEVKQLGIVFGLATDDLEELALTISNLSPIECKRAFRIVVVTHGHRPVIVAHDNKISKFIVQDLPKSEIVDTNGAGDAFAGGFLAQFILGASIENCVGCGNWAAAEVMKNSGCTFPVHKRFNSAFML